MTLKYEGDYYGKRLFSYKPSSTKELISIKSGLVKFHKETFLLLLGKQTKKIVEAGKQHNIKSVPLTGETLSLAIDLVLENCNSEQLPDEGDVAELLDDCHYVLDKRLIEMHRDNPSSMLMHLGERQFPYQESRFNDITRMLYIFYDLWSKSARGAKLGVIKAIEEVIGISLLKAYAFTYICCGNRIGWVYELDQKDLNEVSTKYGIDVTENDFHKYLMWVSVTYGKLAEVGGSELSTMKYPVINTEWTPPNHTKIAYIIRSYYLLWKKLTKGVYYELSDHYKNDGNGNLFKSIFGDVFELYVGKLLKFHFSQWKVRGEFTYSKQNIKTCDWFVHRGKRGIVFEVKQSSAFLAAKTKSSIEIYKKDLQKTVVKGLEQLKKTQEAIQSNKYNELLPLKRVTDFELVIVLWDSLPNANNIIKNIITEERSDLPVNFHILNIEDLETFLSEQKEKENMHELLKQKRKRYNDYDFKEYLVKIFGVKRKPQRFLRIIGKKYSFQNIVKTIQK